MSLPRAVVFRLSFSVLTDSEPESRRPGEELAGCAADREEFPERPAFACAFIFVNKKCKRRSARSVTQVGNVSKAKHDGRVCSEVSSPFAFRRFVRKGRRGVTAHTSASHLGGSDGTSRRPRDEVLRVSPTSASGNSGKQNLDVPHVIARKCAKQMIKLASN